MVQRTRLIATFTFCLWFSHAQAEIVQYRVMIDNTWSTTSHPGAFPHEAHFSWFGGGVHNNKVSFWEVGQPTSPGMTLMAETGVTTGLYEEVEAAVGQGHAMAGHDIHHWFCPTEIKVESCGEPSFLIQASTEFSLVTLVSMLGPSPDWFVGTSGLDLRIGGEWQQEIEIELFPFDGGTRSNNAWTLYGPKEIPPKPVSVITEETGQLVGPESLGTMTLQLIARGDFNADGHVDDDDIDALSKRIQAGDDDALYDLNDDSIVDGEDRRAWVYDVANTTFGDSNLDGVFNSNDLVSVFQANEYGDELALNSSWSTGDWNGDAEFDSSDLVLAFQDGSYDLGPNTPLSAVPEPAPSLILAIGLIGIAIRNRHGKPFAINWE